MERVATSMYLVYMYPELINTIKLFTAVFTYDQI